MGGGSLFVCVDNVCGRDVNEYVYLRPLFISGVSGCETAGTKVAPIYHPFITCA